MKRFWCFLGDLLGFLAIALLPLVLGVLFYAHWPPALYIGTVLTIGLLWLPNARGS